MDRKKTIVAAVMINAGILTVLFIAAMTMREESLSEADQGRVNTALKDPKPVFKEMVEIPAPVPLATESQPVPQAPLVAFTLPAVAFEEPKPTPDSLVALPTPPAVQHPTPIAAAPAGIEIEVQKGDSLEKLAKRHQTSVDEIIKLNQLPSSFLRVGQRLKISSQKMIDAPKLKAAIASAPAPVANEQAEYYTMKVGDNPWSIAMKHHMKVDELLKVNGLNEKSARKLKPGDRLKIR